MRSTNNNHNNNHGYHPSNRHGLHRSQRHNVRRAPAEMTRDEAVVTENEFAMEQQQQQQQRQHCMPPPHSNNSNNNGPGDIFEQQQHQLNQRSNIHFSTGNGGGGSNGQSPTELCDGVSAMRVYGSGSGSNHDVSSQRRNSSPSVSMSHSHNRANQNHGQQQQQHRYRYSISPNNSNGGSNFPSPRLSNPHYHLNKNSNNDNNFGGIYDDDDDHHHHMGNGNSRRGGAGSNRLQSAALTSQQFLAHKHRELEVQQHEREQCFEPVRGAPGMRIRLPCTETLFVEPPLSVAAAAAGSGGGDNNNNDDEMVFRGNAQSRSPLPQQQQQCNDIDNNNSRSRFMILDDSIAFPIPRRPFQRVGPLAQALLRFLSRSSDSLHEALDHTAHIYQITYEMWLFPGNLSDSYESLSQLSLVEVDALLTFGGFTFSSCGKLIVPNAQCAALVPMVAALCDSCEKLLQSFGEDARRNNNSNNSSNRGSGMMMMMAGHDYDGNDNNGNHAHTHDQDEDDDSDSFFPAYNSVGSLRAWCQYANGFGWRDNRDDVQRICNVVRPAGGNNNHHNNRPDVDIALFADAMLTESGAATIAAAMHATLVQAHDRYGSGLAIMLRKGGGGCNNNNNNNNTGGGGGGGGKFAHPRKAGEWHTDELLPAMSDDIGSSLFSPSSASLQMPSQQQQQQQQQQEQHDDSSMRIGGAQRAGGGRVVNSSGSSIASSRVDVDVVPLARIVPCSSDGETKHVDFRNPPSLRAQALCVVSDTNGPMISMCFVHLPQGRRLTFDECRGTGFAFASWLGSLTVPNAMQEHFVFLGVPLRVLNQQQHHQSHTHNIELVREVWTTTLSHAGWQKLTVMDYGMGGGNTGTSSYNNANSSSHNSNSSDIMMSMSPLRQQSMPFAPASAAASTTGSIRPFNGSSSNSNNNNNNYMNVNGSRYANLLESFRGIRQQQQTAAPSFADPSSNVNINNSNANGGHIVPGWILFYRGRTKYSVAGLPKGHFNIFQQHDGDDQQQQQQQQQQQRPPAVRSSGGGGSTSF